MKPFRFTQVWNSSGLAAAKLVRMYYAQAQQNAAKRTRSLQFRKVSSKTRSVNQTSTHGGENIEMSIAVATSATQPVEQTAERLYRPLLLTTEEARRELHVSRDVLYRLIMTGDIGSIKLGKRRLIPYRELEAFAERNTVRGLSA